MVKWRLWLFYEVISLNQVPSLLHTAHPYWCIKSHMTLESNDMLIPSSPAWNMSIYVLKLLKCPPQYGVGFDDNLLFLRGAGLWSFWIALKLKRVLKDLFKVSVMIIEPLGWKRNNSVISTHSRLSIWKSIKVAFWTSESWHLDDTALICLRCPCLHLKAHAHTHTHTHTHTLNNIQKH